MQKDGSIYQGQTVGVNITIDESVTGEIAIGIYGQNSNDKILLRSKDGSLTKVGDRSFSATIPYTVTRGMRTGNYTVELLFEGEDGRFRSIGKMNKPLVVSGSRIGKEEFV